MSAAVVRKKQDDKYLLALRELVRACSNRQCFDCGQKGPTYVNMTIGSFVCTRCSGVLRGLTPPHRVKSISMATFTQDEIDFIRAHGNELCAKTWLGLWDPKRTMHQDHRELMIDKYERKRYYLEPASPLKSLTNAATISSPLNSENNSAQAGQTNGYKQQQQHANSAGVIDTSQLTPPPSQRHNNGVASVSGRSRPPHNQQSPIDVAAGCLTGTGRLSITGSTSTGAFSDASSCASASFTGESDFVANFGTANIYDATTSTESPVISFQNANSSNNNNHNGYAKIQSIKQQQQQQSLLNNNSYNNNSENFADFDHAPIYNANTNVGLPMPNCVNRSLTALSSNAINKKQAPDEDRYAALKDLDEQLRESKATAADTTSVIDVKVLDAYSGNNNVLNSINNNELSTAGNLNPFKAQQQQHQIGDGIFANPFAVIHSMSNPIAVIPSNSSMNCHQQPPAAFYNYCNGVGITMATSPMASGPNGCGFGTMQQKIAGTSNGMMPVGVFNNPFASTSPGVLNTNNPFL